MLCVVVCLFAAPIVAVTIVHGLCHVESGIKNIRALLKLAGREDIRVFVGEHQPLEEKHYHNVYPDAWRAIADKLLEEAWPTLSDVTGVTESAVEYLTKAFNASSEPVRVLALGPLTNIALALRNNPQSSILEIVIMGGAVTVPGNLVCGAPPKSLCYEHMNEVAEWNIFVDPTAAKEVFLRNIPLTMVSLDATNKVKITKDYLQRLEKSDAPHSFLGAKAISVLSQLKETIDAGEMYAWDPLAAVAFLEPEIITWRRADIEVITGVQYMLSNHSVCKAAYLAPFV